MDESADHVRIDALTDRHIRRDFDCGKPWLNSYIRQHAIQNQQMGYGRTYVLVRPAVCERTVEGYYTLSMGNVHFENLPDDLQQRVPKYPMPIAHLGCLAVRTANQGMGMGGMLLIDAMRRIAGAAEIVAARAMTVRAIDDEALRWYRKWGFEPFLDHPHHLYLPMPTVLQVVAASG